MRRKLLALFGVTAVALIGTVAFAAGPVSAATVEDCKTVNAGLTNHPDSGNHGTWALDVIDRTVKVCQLSTTQLSLGQKDEISALSVTHDGSPFSLYSVDVSDTGTFVTKGGAHLSPEDGDALTAGVHGTLEGYYKTFVYALKDWKSWNGDDVDGQVYNPGDSTGEWLKLLFGTHAKWNSPYAWQWVYTTCNQVWKNAAGGNTGDITGEVPCPTQSPSPSPSVTVSPSPSVSVSTSTPTTTAPAPVLNGPDLPTTGDSLTKPAVSGIAAVALGLLLLGSMWLKRRRTAAEVAAPVDEA